MADPPDGDYSRAPELEDLVELCRRLNEADVKYVLIGGFAVILHGFARGTKDIDLLVDSSAQNVAKLRRALSYLPDNAVAEVEDDEMERYAVVRVADEIVVDLMAKACGVAYEEAVRSGGLEPFDLEGVEIPLASKQLLIRLKDTVRPADAMDTQYLRMRIAEESEDVG
ncbi:MAG: hypothetical protein OES32_14310 [Acidobacteriota bacterium]|nr:hypothetical protein [Acidobacteriota bacterium]MDH3524753.1 hypothetical protein [Acidobacteriota bacterium]